jgi:hypothetical protein
MTYTEHWWFSMRMSGVLFYGGICAIVHAFVPDLFITSTTDTVNYIFDQLQSVGCK